MHLCFKLISSCARVRACHLSQRVHLSTDVDKRSLLINACKLAFKRRWNCNQTRNVPLAETISWYMWVSFTTSFYKEINQTIQQAGFVFVGFYSTSTQYSSVAPNIHLKAYIGQGISHMNFLLVWKWTVSVNVTCWCNSELLVRFSRLLWYVSFSVTKADNWND